MPVTYLDPTAEPGVPVEPYEQRLPARMDAPTIGLLANGYFDSEAFLHHLERALAALLPGARFRHYNKGNASMPCPEEMVTDIRQQCDALVTAWGH